MILEISTALGLVTACAPSVAPETVMSIIRVESGFRVFAIGVNGGAALLRQPETEAEAIGVARRLLDEGKNIDLGLGQINSSNLSSLDLTLEEIFDPCTNIKAAGSILEENYRSASTEAGEGQEALQMALSAYNTGDRERGFSNGYVGKVLAASSVVVPAIQTQDLLAPDGAVTLQTEYASAENDGAGTPPAPQPDTPAWDVFQSRSAKEAIVFE